MSPSSVLIAWSSGESCSLFATRISSRPVCSLGHTFSDPDGKKRVQKEVLVLVAVNDVLCVERLEGLSNRSPNTNGFSSRRTPIQLLPLRHLA